MQLTIVNFNSIAKCHWKASKTSDGCRSLQTDNPWTFSSRISELKTQPCLWAIKSHILVYFVFFLQELLISCQTCLLFSSSSRGFHPPTERNISKHYLIESRIDLHWGWAFWQNCRPGFNLKKRHILFINFCFGFHFARIFPLLEVFLDFPLPPPSLF